MDAVDAALLNAVGALFLAEAGGVAGQGQRKGRLIVDGVDELAYHRMLAGTDEIEVLALDLVHHCVHFLEAHNTGNDVTADHIGGDAVGEALIDHKIAGIGQNGAVQAGDVTHQVIEAFTRNAACGLLVDAVELGHNIGVVGDLKIGVGLLTVLHNLDVFAVVLADGHRLVDDVGDLHHYFIKANLKLGLLDLKFLELIGLLGNEGLHFLGFIALALTHQGADLLADFVAVGAQVAGGDVGLQLLVIEGDGLVNEGQLGILELLADVLLYKFGVLPYEFDIEHKKLPLLLKISLIKV